MSLREVQELFWRVVSFPGGVDAFLRQCDAPTRARLEHVFAETRGFERSARLAVYAHAYVERLVHVLESEFPLVQWVLGSELFRDAAMQYVREHQSVEADIAHFGRRFPAFLAAQSFSDAATIAQVADIEWARCEVVAAPNENVLTVDELRRVPVDKWPRLRFDALATTRLFRASWDFGGLFREFSGGGDVTAARRRARAGARRPPRNGYDVLVYRHDLYVRHRALESNEARVLRLLCNGATFEEACEVALTGEAGSLSPEDVAQWVIGWVEASLFREYREGAHTRGGARSKRSSKNRADPASS